MRQTHEAWHLCRRTLVERQHEEATKRAEAIEVFNEDEKNWMRDYRTGLGANRTDGQTDKANTVVYDQIGTRA